MNNIAERKIHLGGLDALRFFSALSIILLHSAVGFWDNYPAPIKQFGHNLGIGVDCFFIISGFLIVYLLIVEKNSSGSISLYNFYVRRTLRIFPLYYLNILIAFILYDVLKPNLVYTPFLLFWANFFMIKINTFTGENMALLWSLCIEEHFYLVIPLLTLLLPTKYLNYLFFIVILISIGFRIWVINTGGEYWMKIYLHTLSRCDLLAVGGLVAYYHFKKPFSFHINPMLFNIPLAAFMGAMCFLDYNFYDGTLNASLGKYVFVIPMCLMMLFFVFNDNGEKSIIEKIKRNRVVSYLGKISFGLYIYHGVINDQLTKVELFYHPLIKPLAVFVLTSLAATLSYELFEKQIIKLKKKFEIVKTSH